MARQDVLAAYDIYVANHPGMHDPHNPSFPQKLKQAREAGLRAAVTATDRGGYAEALGLFSAELSDGHALAFAKPLQGAIPPKREWPGFIATWRGDGMVVHHSTPGAPPAGARIVSCNGMPVSNFVKKRLAAGNFRHAEAGIWWARAQNAFIASPTFAKDKPQRCVFQTGGGNKELKLNWSPAPENLDPLRRIATDGERTAIGLSEPMPGIFLVGLPDFQPNEESVKSYRAMFETLRARRADLAKAKAIVLDLRHNNGGSSSWSYQTAQALWGDEVVKQRMDDYFKDVRIWWRASDANIAYMSEMEAKIRKDGNTNVADGVRKSGEGMKTARAKGEPFYVTGNEKALKPKAARLDSDFTVPVYVITPGGCASACLDAVDTFKRFDNVKLIGAPTSGDSTYMEARNQDLPSGRGVIVIPNKIWVGRPRGSGEIYKPDIEVTDTDWSTATFLHRIEQDLRRTS
jgi:hypothetical protein